MGNDSAGTALLDSARAFRPRILAERERIEAGRRIPDDLAKDLARAGFFRISLPAVYGGLDLTPVEGLTIYEELARADASVAWCVWNGNVNWVTAQISPDAALEIFADPAAILANSTQPRGQAAVVEGGYRVSGHWSLVSGCQISERLTLLCAVHENGEPRMTQAGAPDLRFMYCPSADCEIVDTWTAGGLRGTGSHDVIVRDHFVPERFAASWFDPVALTEPCYRFPFTSRVIPGCGAIALGVARGAIEALIELGGAKRPERSRQVLAEDRGAQARLAQAEALVRSARLYLFDAVSCLWESTLAGAEPSPEGRAQVRLATYHAVTSAAEAVDLVYLTGGATSLYTSSPLERAFRDVHAIPQHISVHPSIVERIGRVLFGLEPDGTMPL
jgi:alkylation response protein AidB-like acyl-CoA dehydrogenase